MQMQTSKRAPTHHPPHPPHLGAAVIIAGLAAAAALPTHTHAQSCIWMRHSTQPLGDGSMVYHAGLQQVLHVGSTQIWAWNGTAWTFLATNEAGPRQGGAVAYDSARDRLIIFGGRSGNTYLGDTVEWDGTTWTQWPTSPSGPSRRIGRLVHDEARGRTVLFGGLSAPGVHLSDTWEWDGASWTLAATAGPGPLGGPGLVYDSARGRTVLYGRGAWSSPPPPPQWWEWDGSAWLERPIAGPTAPMYWMVFDPVRARMIAGHYDGYVQPLFETWEIDTSTLQWHLRTPGTAPLGPAAFDAARSRAVVRWNSATWEYNASGTLLSPYIIQHPLGGGNFAIGAQVILTVQAGGSNLSYQWRHEQQPLVNGGNISGADTDTLTINPMQSEDRGWYDVVITNPCDSVTTEPVGVGPIWYCYPDCDGASSEPILTIDDFTCFINEFAFAQNLPHEQQLLHYANCDQSTTPPVLNVDDFTCFINAFAQGCP